METTTKEAELEKEIKDLEAKLKSKEIKITNLKDENDEFVDRIEELESNEPFCIDGTTYDNLRGKMVFEKLFSNLQYLPIDELETLVQKHAVL